MKKNIFIFILIIWYFFVYFVYFFGFFGFFKNNFLGINLK